MKIAGTNRTYEVEQRLKAIRVQSEDTCSFWDRSDDTVIALKRCYYCKHYEPESKANPTAGYCKFKAVMSIQPEPCENKEGEFP